MSHIPSYNILENCINLLPSGGTYISFGSRLTLHECFPYSCKSNSKIKYGALKYRPNEIWRMQADIAFLKKIGFKHSINFDEGLKRTVNWYKNFLKLYIHEKSILNRLSYYD